MAQRVLLIEDDRKLAPLVQRFLAEHHYEVRWSPDGDRGWRDFQSFDPHLVVLDLMLPGRDGLSLCRDIRTRSSAAILILTARGDELDRVLGLELGADDYLTKPFSLKELLARIRAILRRCHPAAPPPDTTARRFGPFQLDPQRRTLSLEGRSIELTRSEFDLLELLSRAPGRVYSRDRLLQAIRGGETEAFDRAVDSHISNLRKKIEPNPRKPQYIETVWGLGYRWADS